MSTNVGANDISLARLSDTDLTLADTAQDIRGRKVIDSESQAIGHVSALFIDPGERKVRMLDVHVGGILGVGGHHVLIPIEAVVAVTPDVVRIGRTRGHVVDAPTYDPELIIPPERDSFSPYYGYYGYTPFWGEGYLTGRERQEP
jgi:sporulation protein YlmC with PRC-barrel domain